MAVTDAQDVEETASRVSVAALGSSPDRTVFTEAGNVDGWISTDVTVDLER
ncbi:hypothetical protein [Halorarum salinum]|uniref:Uncharacterized protein n=1 Tax=Halorarum salinum TaxID=2743089 RepID=A0A7D5LBK5_9EURY|nr:hypothetical protein [Halobaculum salinum]QLG62671.1 hypothetical protein HUG12_13420 [Halobaculum salinum]